SWSGLGWLIDRAEAERFPRVFRDNWTRGTRHDGDALVLIGADRLDDLRQQVKREVGFAEHWGVKALDVYWGNTLPDELRGHEHFGIKYLVSQPTIAGWEDDKPGPGGRIPAGEVILGEPDAAGTASLSGLPVWTRGGSFLVFLQLRQHVAEF